MKSPILTVKIYICCNLWFRKFTLGRWNLPHVKNHCARV